MGHFASLADHTLKGFQFTAGWMDRFVLRHNVTGRLEFDDILIETNNQPVETVNDLFLERVLTPVGLAGVLKLQQVLGVLLFQSGENATPGLPKYVSRCEKSQVMLSEKRLNAALAKQVKIQLISQTTRSTKRKVAAAGGSAVQDVIQAVTKRRAYTSLLVVEPGSDNDDVSNLNSPFAIIDLSYKVKNNVVSCVSEEIHEFSEFDGLQHMMSGGVGSFTSLNPQPALNNDHPTPRCSSGLSFSFDDDDDEVFDIFFSVILVLSYFVPLNYF
jgi:hypothetical protein